MTIKHCVIHRNCVYIEARRRDYGEELEIVERAEKAQKTIDDLISNEDPDNVLKFDQRNPEEVADYFEKGDEVILYGAYLGMCLAEAKTALIKKRVKVSYHPDGCI